MSKWELDPNIPPLGDSREFLIRNYPNANFYLPASFGAVINKRYRAAGFGLAAIIFRDADTGIDSAITATYVLTRTPIVDAMNSIYHDEQDERLPKGSHKAALVDIGTAQFVERWGSYITGQNS